MDDCFLVGMAYRITAISEKPIKNFTHCTCTLTGFFNRLFLFSGPYNEKLIKRQQSIPNGIYNSKKTGFYGNRSMDISHKGRSSLHKPVPFGPFATQDDVATSYFVQALPSLYVWLVSCWHPQYHAI